MEKERISEGLGILQAIITEDCGKCPYYEQCIRDTSFTYPANAACMKFKENFLLLLSGGENNAENS